ncbi:hypothetical protein C8Q80DRAFT_1275770 [Daedaleopsis nitida]|nr:hypothetical protein C8Q80DRAFT_1275770 [Daedaleopsis nitida]
MALVQPPQLRDTDMLQVFVYHTAPNSEKNHQFEMLGRRMLDAAYVAAIAQGTNPGRLGNTNLQTQIEDFANHWVGIYGWRGLMKAVPPGVDLNNRQESLRIFRTYVGAVYATYGDQALFQWIAAIA